MADPSESEPLTDVDVFVCGTLLCADGKPHDDDAHVEFPGGESVACSRCGSSAFERDLLRLP